MKYSCRNCEYETDDGREGMWHASDEGHDVVIAASEIRPAEVDE